MFCKKVVLKSPNFQKILMARYEKKEATYMYIYIYRNSKEKNIFYYYDCGLKLLN